MKFNRVRTSDVLPVTDISDEDAKYVKENTTDPVETHVPELEEKEFDREALTAVNVRRAADPDSEIIATLCKNSLVGVKIYDDEWYQITSGIFKGGYVRRAFLK